MDRFLLSLFVFLTIICGVVSEHPEYNSTLDSEEGPAHKCIHDTILSQLGPTYLPFNNGQDYGEDGRRLSTSELQGLRIVPDYTHLVVDGDLTQAKRDFLVDTLIPTTFNRFKDLLYVNPVQGNLRAQRMCVSWYATSGMLFCAQALGNAQCGNLPNDPQIVFDESKLDFLAIYNDQLQIVETFPAGTGYANADTVIFVTAVQTPRCGSSNSGVLAYALTCQRDQYDRPTFGRINFCPHAIDTNPSQFSRQLNVAMHEVAHVLGFSSSSWPLFREHDAARSPRTVRNPIFQQTVHPNHYVQSTCGGSYSSPRDVPVPSMFTVNYFTERDSQCFFQAGSSAHDYVPPNMDPFHCVARMVTPTVVEAAREFFGCSNLPGAELENSVDFASCEIQGSHWEQRVFNNELMAPVQRHVMPISAVTLALFQDSGWYVPDYNQADEFRENLSYGYKQGCAFARNECSNDNSGSPPHWYLEPGGRTYEGDNAVCTTDHKAVGLARVSTWSGNLPSRFQYFSDPKLGGSLEYDDYCPTVNGYSNLVCEDPNANIPTGAVTGQYAGTGGLCLNNDIRIIGVSSPTRGAGCYMTQCVSYDIDNNVYPYGQAPFAALQITVSPSQDPVVVYCTEFDDEVEVPGYTGKIDCPNVKNLCASGERYRPSGAIALPHEEEDLTPSRTPSRSHTPSRTATTTTTKTRSSTRTPTPSRTASVTGTASNTGTQSGTSTPSQTPSHTSTPHHVSISIRLGIPGLTVARLFDKPDASDEKSPGFLFLDALLEDLADIMFVSYNSLYISKISDNVSNSTLEYMYNLHSDDVTLEYMSPHLTYNISASGTRTNSPTPSRTATRTRTPTRTPTRTRTPTKSPTFTATRTPSPVVVEDRRLQHAQPPTEPYEVTLENGETVTVYGRVEVLVHGAAALVKYEEDTLQRLSHVVHVPKDVTPDTLTSSSILSAVVDASTAESNRRFLQALARKHSHDAPGSADARPNTVAPGSAVPRGMRSSAHPSAGIAYASKPRVLTSIHWNIPELSSNPRISRNMARGLSLDPSNVLYVDIGFLLFRAGPMVDDCEQAAANNMDLHDFNFGLPGIDDATSLALYRLMSSTKQASLAVDAQLEVSYTPKAALGFCRILDNASATNPTFATDCVNSLNDLINFQYTDDHEINTEGGNNNNNNNNTEGPGLAVAVAIPVLIVVVAIGVGVVLYRRFRRPSTSSPVTSSSHNPSSSTPGNPPSSNPGAASHAAHSTHTAPMVASPIGVYPPGVYPPPASAPYAGGGYPPAAPAAHPPHPSTIQNLQYARGPTQYMAGKGATYHTVSRFSSLFAPIKRIFSPSTPPNPTTNPAGVSPTSSSTSATPSTASLSGSTPRIRRNRLYPVDETHNSLATTGTAPATYAVAAPDATGAGSMEKRMEMLNKVTVAPNPPSQGVVQATILQTLETSGESNARIPGEVQDWM